MVNNIVGSTKQTYNPYARVRQQPPIEVLEKRWLQLEPYLERWLERSGGNTHDWLQISGVVKKIVVKGRFDVDDFRVVAYYCNPLAEAYAHKYNTTIQSQLHLLKSCVTMPAHRLLKMIESDPNAT